MTDEQIKAEFNRWIESGRPDVWMWFEKVNRWETVSKFSWDKDTFYVVDDEYAKIRKQFIDDRTKIEYRQDETKKWRTTECIDIESFTCILYNKPRCYRIKPEEPVYEWQYATIIGVNGTWYLSSYKTDEEIKEQTGNWVKFEPSKRIRK